MEQDEELILLPRHQKLREAGYRIISRRRMKKEVRPARIRLSANDAQMAGSETM